MSEIFLVSQTTYFRRRAVRSTPGLKRYLAYRMTGIVTIDQGKLLSGEPLDFYIIDDITKRALQQYKVRREAGMLTSLQIRDRHPLGLGKKGRSFIEEFLAGDNEYVFLHVGKRYWYEPEVVNFGFVFDAIKLIQQGAILRRHDLLAAYEDLLDTLVAEKTGFRDPTEWSQEEQAAMLAAVNDPNFHLTYVGPNEPYYRLHDAVYLLNTDVPGVQEIIDQFQRTVKAEQTKVQVTGSEAVAYIEKTGEDGQAELLVPGQLSLSEAIGFVEYGEIVFR